MEADSFGGEKKLKLFEKKLLHWDEVVFQPRQNRCV